MNRMVHLILALALLFSFLPLHGRAAETDPLRRKQQGFGLRGFGRQFDRGAKLFRQNAKTARIGQAAQGLIQRS